MLNTWTKVCPFTANKTKETTTDILIDVYTKFYV